MTFFVFRSLFSYRKLHNLETKTARSRSWTDLASTSCSLWKQQQEILEKKTNPKVLLVLRQKKCVRRCEREIWRWKRLFLRSAHIYAMQCTQTKVRADAYGEWYLQLALTCKQTAGHPPVERRVRTDSWRDEAVPGEVNHTPEPLYSTWRRVNNEQNVDCPQNSSNHLIIICRFSSVMFMRLDNPGLQWWWWKLIKPLLDEGKLQNERVGDIFAP